MADEVSKLNSGCCPCCTRSPKNNYYCASSFRFYYPAELQIIVDRHEIGSQGAEAFKKFLARLAQVHSLLLLPGLIVVDHDAFVRLVHKTSDESSDDLSKNDHDFIFDADMEDDSTSPPGRSQVPNDSEMLANEDSIEVSGVKIFFPMSEKPVVIGHKVMFPNCVVENEITFRGIELRIAKDMNAEHTGDFLRVYRRNSPPHRKGATDDWPYSWEINLRCEDKELIKTYDIAVKHLKQTAIEKHLWIKNTKLYYPPYISPIHRPHEIDFSTDKCETKNRILFQGKRGSITLVIDTDHMPRYVDGGVQICDRVCGTMDLHALAKALERPDPYDISGAGLSPADELRAMVPGFVVHKEHQLMVRDLTIYYPITVRHPSVENKEVKFENALDAMPANEIRLHPPANYEVLYDGNEVHLYPPQMGMLNVVPLLEPAEQRKANRIGRRDRAPTIDAVAAKFAAISLSDPPAKSATPGGSSQAGETIKSAVQAAWNASYQSSGSNNAEDVEGEDSPKASLSKETVDPLPDSLLNMIQEMAEWQDSLPDLSDFTTRCPQFPGKGEDKATQTSSRMNSAAQVPDVRRTSTKSNDVLQELATHERLDSTETPDPLLSVTEGCIGIRGGIKVFFPDDMEHVVSDDYIQLGDGEGSMENYRSSDGSITVFCPAGWRTCYHPEGQVVVRNEEYDEKLDEFLLGKEEKPEGQDGQAVTFADKHKCLLEVATYPEDMIEVGGVNILYPTDAVPLVHDSTVRFPGGMTREIVVVTATTNFDKKATLILGEEWDLTRDMESKAVVFRKSHPSVKPEEIELPDIDKAVRQHTRHCDKCPPIKTPYFELYTWAQGEKRKYWFWYPSHLKPATVEGKGYPILRFPGSKRHCHIGEIEVHYPPNCDIVLGHEIHIYPKDSKVIETYKQSIANKIYHPKPPRLLGTIIDVIDTTFLCLTIEPAEREATIKEEADWIAGQDPKEVEKYKNAEERSALVQELGSDEDWSDMVFGLVDKAAEKIRNTPGLSKADKQTKMNQQYQTIYDEAIQKEARKREKSETAKGYDRDAAEWLACFDEKGQRLHDIIEALRKQDREREEEEQLQGWKEHVDETMPMPDGAPEAPDALNRQLTEEENEVMEEWIEEIMVMKGHRARPRPAKRVGANAAPLGTLLQVPKFA